MMLGTAILWCYFQVLQSRRKRKLPLFIFRNRKPREHSKEERSMAAWLTGCHTKREVLSAWVLILYGTPFWPGTWGGLFPLSPLATPLKPAVLGTWLRLESWKFICPKCQLYMGLSESCSQFRILLWDCFWGLGIRDGLHVFSAGPLSNKRSGAFLPIFFKHHWKRRGLQVVEEHTLSSKDVQMFWQEGCIILLTLCWGLEKN